MNGLSDVRLALHSQELVNEHLVKTKSAMAVAVKTRSTPNLGWWATLCHRWTSRRALRELNADQLRDIGISPEQARQEGVKPFWRG